MSESTFGNTAIAQLASNQIARGQELEAKLSEKETQIKVLEEMLKQEQAKTKLLEQELMLVRVHHAQRVALEARVVSVLAETRNGLGQLLELFLARTQ